MMTDPIAELLTKMRNGSLKNHRMIMVQFSELKKAVLEVFKRSKFIQDFRIVEDEKKKYLEVLLFTNKPLAVKRVSSPGRRVYQTSEDLRSVKNGLGISVVSTSKGVLNNKEARKEKVGGEILCEIF